MSRDEGDGATLVMQDEGPALEPRADEGDNTTLVMRGATDVPASRRARDARAGRGLVLVVDAEPGSPTSLLLRAAGYEVKVADDTVAATQLLASEPFNAVLTDVSMPGMSGVDLLRFTHEFHAHLPVLLMTGTPDIESAAQAVELGAFQYLLKPISPERLVGAVEKAVVAQRLARARTEAVEALEELETVYDPALDHSRLSGALRSLWMAYQPILRPDGTLFAYEALLRTDEPGFTGPGDLLDAAERLHRLHDVGRAVRSKAGRLLAHGAADWALFINLHPHDLLDETLTSPDGPLAAIAPMVVLEITERAAVHDIAETRARMADLRAMGFRIALDDLGAGYAGLTSFITLQPEIVKIDMGLVRDVDRDPVKQKLIRTITTLGRDMGMLVVGEGIETAGERSVLVDAGVHLLQGYLLGRPERL